MAALCPSLAPWLPSAGGWQQPGLVPASSTNTAEARLWDVQGGRLWDLCPTQLRQLPGHRAEPCPGWGAAGVAALTPVLWQAVQPDACHTAFDAAATIRGELFFFRSRFVWRLRAGKLQDGYPALASRHWQGIPSSVDATFEDPLGNIWFFQGKSCTVIRRLRNASQLLRGSQDPAGSWENKSSAIQ